MQTISISIAMLGIIIFRLDDTKEDSSFWENPKMQTSRLCPKIFNAFLSYFSHTWKSDFKSIRYGKC